MLGQSSARRDDHWQRADIRHYSSNIVFKDEAVNMDLTSSDRILVHAGKLMRSPEAGLKPSGWKELFVLLFDNYLLMTKPKGQGPDRKYHVWKRPICIELLDLTNFDRPPVQRGNSIRNLVRSGRDTPGGSPHPPEHAFDSRAAYPMTILHGGRSSGSLTLFADSVEDREEWKRKLDEAISIRKIVQDRNRVFRLETLIPDALCAPGSMKSLPNMITGKITCSLPFTTSDGRNLIAFGSEEGIWIGTHHDPNSLRRVLHIPMVTQCSVLVEYSIFIILADGSLIAFDLEALVPSLRATEPPQSMPQKLSRDKDIHFFSTGYLDGRMRLIYKRKRGAESVFRVLELVKDKVDPPPASSKPTSRTEHTTWFRVYRDFFLPSDAYDIIFLKTKVAIFCPKGFEIMNLSDYYSVTIPQQDTLHLEKLSKKCSAGKPIGMFRLREDEFFSAMMAEFGLYVNRRGDPCRLPFTIEWEGSAKHAAWHPPYVLLFNESFIEIRHVESGRLAQVIAGHDIRSLWDGRGAINAGCGGLDYTALEQPRVHGVMDMPEIGISAAQPTMHHDGKQTVQRVFELVPTERLLQQASLYLPPLLSDEADLPPYAP
ncbi:Rho1 guanine nucleotide exchange factor 1 [Grifola frondosa]|uniref:Rho1 guanine nucleotide exchange factor 1 n=1 Tax=Grifola frondosa TaxID=5627 RepID=A0A1C7MD60_GRIFR|nr:Rho1 guanine nucleotide exchange factor 1 [Grifola frondosa]